MALENHTWKQRVMERTTNPTSSSSMSIIEMNVSADRTSRRITYIGTRLVKQSDSRRVQGLECSEKSWSKQLREMKWREREPSDGILL